MQNPLEVKPDEVKKEETLSKESTNSIPADGELDKLTIARSFGIENFDEMQKYDDQLSTLYEWAKLKGAKSREDVAWQVRELRNLLGGPGMGTPMVRHLAQYAYLEMERIKVDRQMKEMEHA